MSSSSSFRETLLGSWTLETSSTADWGYYRATAWLVMHVVLDPLKNVWSCTLKDCHEAKNQACMFVEEGKEDDTHHHKCVNTTETLMEWSDVLVFFQYGVDVHDGVIWNAHVTQNTSGWLGPYNWLLAAGNNDDDNDNDIDVVRSYYVTTPSTHSLRLPPQNTLIPSKDFPSVAGMTAVQTSMQQQIHNHDWMPRADPYNASRVVVVPTKNTKHPKHDENGCKNKNNYLKPILPRLQLTERGRLQFDFPLLTLSSSSSSKAATTTTTTTTSTSMGNTNWNHTLNVRKATTSAAATTTTVDWSKLWPTLSKHLPDFPIMGPYCYHHHDNIAKEVWAVNISYDSAAHDFGKNNTWTLTKGCKPHLPCWDDNDNGPSSNDDSNHSHHHHHHPIIPDHGHDSNPSNNDDADLNRALLTYGCYVLILAVIVSLAFNMHKSLQLNRLRARLIVLTEEGQQQSPPQQVVRRRTRRIVARRNNNASNNNNSGGGDDDEGLREPLLSSTNAAATTTTTEESVEETKDEVVEPEVMTAAAATSTKEEEEEEDSKKPAAAITEMV